MTGPYLQVFHEQHAKNAVNVLHNFKEQRIHQHKKIKARTEQVAKPKRICFDVNELSSPSSLSSSSDSEDDSLEHLLNALHFSFCSLSCFYSDFPCYYWLMEVMIIALYISKIICELSCNSLYLAI